MELETAVGGYCWNVEHIQGLLDLTDQTNSYRVDESYHLLTLNVGPYGYVLANRPSHNILSGIPCKKIINNAYVEVTNVNDHQSGINRVYTAIQHAQIALFRTR